MENNERTSKDKENLFSLLLDSSLITQTNRQNYDCKIVYCGDYLQIYTFPKKVKKNQDLEELDLTFEDNRDYLLELDLFKNEINRSRRGEKGFIEYKNLLRSKYEMERLVKCNENIFKTFITLTFAENITDINLANKKFNSWKTYIKRLKNDFAYVLVPEFQKRGAVHYHLLTNLDISIDKKIIIPQIDVNTKKVLKNRYDVLGWKHGFSRVDKLTDVKIVTYLSKYMTKDYDKRLYCHRRYSCSYNLKKPVTSYLDLSNEKHLKLLNELYKSKKLAYNKEYIDYFGDKVNFFEYTSQHNMYYTKLL